VGACQNVKVEEKKDCDAFVATCTKCGQSSAECNAFCGMATLECVKCVNEAGSSCDSANRCLNECAGALGGDEEEE